MAQTSLVDLVGVGLNATDTRIRIADFPTCGSKVEYETETVMAGGQVASTVVACQAWGLSTRYVGKLGDDDAARLHTREFERTGVDAKLVRVEGAPSAKSLILVDRYGERTVLCRRDERLLLKPEELNRDWIVNAKALHVDGYDTAAATVAAGWAREAGIPVVADLDDVTVEESDDEADPDDEIDEEAPVLTAVAEDDDDLADDADVELALDEVLAETIRRTTAPEDDDDGPIEVDPLVDPLEAILPKQDDEFRCKSCRLLKKMSQLADPDKTLCRDCV